MDVRLLLRLLRRELCAYPGQALLTLLGIALGVAVVNNAVGGYGMAEIAESAACSADPG